MNFDACLFLYEVVLGICALQLKLVVGVSQHFETVLCSSVWLPLKKEKRHDNW